MCRFVRKHLRLSCGIPIHGRILGIEIDQAIKLFIDLSFYIIEAKGLNPLVSLFLCLSSEDYSIMHIIFSRSRFLRF